MDKATITFEPEGKSIEVDVNNDQLSFWYEGQEFINITIFQKNDAVAGARLILLSPVKLEEAEKIVQDMTNIDLSTNNMFFNDFTTALFLPHTNIDLFPSVKDLKLGTEGF